MGISRISSPELGTNQGLMGISILETGEFSKSENELRYFALHKGWCCLRERVPRDYNRLGSGPG